MLKSRLNDYSDPCILVSGTIIIDGARASDTAKQLDESYKGVIFKNYAPFADYISEIDNNQIDNVKNLDVWSNITEMTQMMV